MKTTCSSSSERILFRCEAGLQRVATLGALALALASAGCADVSLAEQPEEVVGKTTSALTHSDSAFHWAPVHYQDLDKQDGLGGLADYIAKFNYDGTPNADDWNGLNNWDNLTRASQPEPVAYTHVDETATHWFISYLFLHPRDWSVQTLHPGQHENDMEGVLVFVRKDTTTFGTVEGMITVYHERWLSYRNPGPGSYLSAGRGNRDEAGVRNMFFETSGLPSDTVPRPMTIAQGQGHGLAGCNTQFNCGFSNNDVARYQPTQGAAPFVSPPTTNVIKSIPYALKEVREWDGLWTHRFDHSAMASWSRMRGDASGTCTSSCSSNDAGTAWGTAMGGSDSNMFWLFADPAHAVSEYFTGWDNSIPSIPSRAISLDYVNDTLGAAHSWQSNPWQPADRGAIGTNGKTDTAIGATTFEDRMYLFSKTLGAGAQGLNFSTFDGSTWKIASAVPGGLTTDQPAAATECAGKLFVVAKPGVGSQQLKFTSKANTGNASTGWDPSWAPVPGATSNLSAALACRDNLLTVFFKGSDDHIYFQWFDPASNGWVSTRELPGGGVTYLAPAAVYNPSNYDTDVVVVGTNGKLYLNQRGYYSDAMSWSGWMEHQGWSVSSSPVALVYDDVNGTSPGVHLLSRGPFNRIEVDSLNNYSWEWRGPASVRGHQYTYLAPAAARLNGMIYTFAVGVFNGAEQVWYTQSKAPGRLLSYRKPATQTSILSGAGPDRAVDGRTDSSSDSYFDGQINAVFNSGYVSHTGAANLPWWRVDLGTVRTINQIDVYNRDDSCCRTRLSEWSIWVSNDDVTYRQVFNDSRSGGAGRLTSVNGRTPAYNGGNAGTTVAGPWTGRFVKVQINRNNEYLHLAEVQVWGN